MVVPSRCLFSLADGGNACELVQQYLREEGFVPSSRKRAEVKTRKTMVPGVLAAPGIWEGIGEGRDDLT